MPFFNVSNLFIGIIAVLMLTLAIIAISWLCCNGAVNNNKKQSIKSNQPPSNATLTSGTSASIKTTNSSDLPKNCHTAVTLAKCRLTATNAIKKAFFQTTITRQQRTPPPPPRIPIPKAPQQVNGSGRTQQQQQLLLPKIDIPTNSKNQISKTQHLTFNNNDLLLNSSPLIWMSKQPQQKQRFERHSEHQTNKVPIKAATDTLDRRYRIQQQIYQKTTTRADDEMSRLSSNIYGNFINLYSLKLIFL